MALTLSTAARNAACDAVVDLIDGGSANPTGALVIGTTGMGTTLVTCNFSNPAFGAAATGVATANAISDGTAVATGTAAEANIVDRDAASIITGLTVATSAANVNLSSTGISTNDVVSITSGTVTMPAS